MYKHSFSHSRVTTYQNDTHPDGTLCGKVKERYSESPNLSESEGATRDALGFCATGDHFQLQLQITVIPNHHQEKTLYTA